MASVKESVVGRRTRGFRYEVRDGREYYAEHRLTGWVIPEHDPYAAGWRSMIDSRRIFIHIPKTGGISVARAIFGNAGIGHKSARFVRRRIGPIAYRRSFSFTFVRDPFERCHSAFEFLKSGGMNGDDAAWADAQLSEFVSFEDFVAEGLSRPAISGHLHFRSQSAFIFDPADNLLVDFVGRHEELQADFGRLCATIAVQGSLPWLNRSNWSRATKAFPQSVRDRVIEHYARDYQLLKYRVV